FSMNAGNEIYDIKVEAFNSTFNITMHSVNLSNSSGSSLTLDELTLSQSGYNFKGAYAFNTSLNFTHANISVSYSWLNLTSTEEQYIALYKCADWNYALRACGGAWGAINATVLNYSDTIIFNETALDPSYAIHILSYCGDGSCNGLESCLSCAGDCGACAAAPSGGSPSNSFSVSSSIRCVNQPSSISVAYSGSPVSGAEYTLRYTGTPSATVASGSTPANGEIPFTPQAKG
ncbi:hypothetical protein COV61_01845, partial [Candidatus Micrarchaeota archaeon CG11_big_fil_rev_8_21_14_0_20_47_5]